ncbi:uncharacterized protein LOC107643190 isoform X1 [Arachis ipaensis]|uniref:uncharacterized protein LOC107643190 isoform X1 n=1 Tax=Arachis ipaensis TaxID=130454 RepID=UPI000A2B2D91|nr:uncharacterized protein LOC107643190 isoform X1 [Arachis ipaensis]
MKLGPLSEKNWGLFNANGAPKKGKTPDSCHFDGVASISTTDPRKEKQEDNVNRVQQQEGRVKRVKRAIISASNMASIEDPISHISGSVLPAHKSVRVVNEIVRNKRLASHNVMYQDLQSKNLKMHFLGV